MHFEVHSDEELKGMEVIALNPKSFSNSSWSKKNWQIFDGKKINGTGSGFFEYEFSLPEKFNNNKFKKTYFIIEASAKELFDKDKEGKDYIDAGIDYMKGSKVSPSKNPNSYPMTDSKKFPSKIQIFINGKKKNELILIDDPADHRGILSWHHQKRSETSEPPSLNEAGSYGYLIKIPVSKIEFDNAIKRGKISIRLKTEDGGGIAIYGDSFGRYPINPSLVFKK